ncbi:SDR family oxidoreductase [Corallococcus sp. EGB]|uniref:SDR family NAD(P)-dependent oxidoreductase n=1 Tax=Corallococcus sp. EGB TaxID=1521117 RepID=UPI001CC14877|nr:SDR family NAD(P)-dependent oxidoreductase [Corallococcus sp. EGB]
MAERMRLQGRTAVVTGAASGIGRAIAVCLARKGCHVALADVNEAGLAETADLARTPEVRISQHRLDVSDKAAVEDFPAQVMAEHPGVDLLFNNAGVALGGTFEQVSAEDFEWLFNINFWGVVRLSRAFLPLLRKSDDARLVNLSSVFGLVAPPGQVAYAASKFAVRGFSEGLRHELEGTNVGVTVVHPGGVATSIAASARVPTGATAEEVSRRRRSFQKMLRLPAEAAGAIIVRGVENRESRILVGKDAVALAMLARLFPVTYWKLLASRLRGA